jgi:hypothetical protein
MGVTRTQRTSPPTSLRGAFLVTVFALCLTLALAVNALAASGTPINIGTPYESGPPSVAVDASGTAYIAWANTKDLAPVTTDIVQYCVLPAGAAACSHTGSLAPADGGSNIDGVDMLVDESTDPATIVILADVYGTAGGSALKYAPEQEWQSTDGGATFAIVDGGKSVAEGNVDGDTAPLNAVQVPGTDELGFGWDAAVAPPTFHAFPLSSPPECSEESGGCPAGFATLEPETNPDGISNGGGQFASQAGSYPGVLGIFFTDFSNGPLACSPLFGTAYAYASGAQSSTNNYNLSPGKPNSAWRVAAAQADCNVEYFAVAGGPSGFGVLQDDTANNNIVYQKFNQTTESFGGSPSVTIAGNQQEEDPAVSQDGSGGIYATFLLGGGGGPISLAYSENGGASWAGPTTIYANTDGGANELTSSVGPSGQGWAAWLDNGSVYAQQFVAADAIVPPTPTTLTTSQTSGTTSGASLTIPAGTVGETDHATLAGTNAGIATGTVSYALYSTPTCTGPSVISNTAAVAGGVAGPSSAITTALSPGTYYWRAAYSGDARNDASASACGSEVLTVIPAVVIEGSAAISGSSVTITVSCPSAEPCTVSVTVSGTEITIVVKKASAARKKVVHKKTITLATGKFTIPGKSTKKLELKLTKAGKRLLKREHGHLKASVRISDKTPGGLELTTRTIAIHTVKPKHKK